jgi:hypothetical protein
VLFISFGGNTKELEMRKISKNEFGVDNFTEQTKKYKPVNNN